MRAAGLTLAPTFIPFTPWTTRESYREFLRALVDLDLADQVAPIQLAIRLLIPEGSLLLELAGDPRHDRALRSARPVLPLAQSDPAMDTLCASIQETIKREERRQRGRVRRSSARSGTWPETGEFPVDVPLASRATIPYLTEPWYC